MKKKAISLGLNTIVIAIIVLLVMVLIIYMVSGGAKNFNKGTSCPALSGVCKSAEKCDGNTVAVPDANKNPSDYCTGIGEVCCKILG